ncbi:hypothetical protein MUP37_01485, partial [Candidatus Bathyarchaeota archaeon]|nr:hypothetical protein [Candidatus Bathyarchaeota archaeon]
ENVLMTDTTPEMRLNLVGEMYMGLHYRGNFNLNNLMKKIPMIILGMVLITLIMPSALAAARANLQIQGTEWYRFDTDDLYSGTYPAQYSGSVSIMNYPDTGTILGNITYRIDAENITSYNDMQYATRNGSSIQWVFPENITLPENTYIITGFRSDYYNNRHIPITVHRSFNKTVFSSDGYQRASFSVAFENFSYTMDNVSLDKVWGGITTHDNSEVNASIVAGSFTTDMPIWRDPQNNPQKITGHLIEFGNDSQFLQEHQVYNFSVLIHVHRKNPGGPPIEYYPTFSIALQGGKVDLDSLPNFTAIAPSSLLPKYMHYASGSTNVSNQWTYSRTAMLGFALNSTTRISGNNSVANIGVFRPASGYWYFDNNLDGIVDKSFRYGGAGDRIIKGNWQGTGKDGIAIFRPSSGYWYFDNNLDGIVDKSFRFGGSDDQIIVGKWNGTAQDGIAIFRPASGFWYFDYNLDGIVDKSFRFGGVGDRII